MRLVAIRPVLYRSVQYGVGAELPADNEAMVEAWVAFKSASWAEDEPPRKPPKAVPVSPPDGKAGLSSDGDPAARLGRRSKR